MLKNELTGSRPARKDRWKFNDMEELLTICRLVRMSVFGTEEDIPKGADWPKVFSDAGINGVSALCYEAVKRLPPDRQPDFNLMLR